MDHIFVVVQHTNKGTKLSSILGGSYLQDGIDFFLLGLDAVLRQDKSKILRFKSAERGFQGINL